jgi:hypothetical protein
LKEEGRRKKEEGRRKKEEGRRKKEEGRRKNWLTGLTGSQAEPGKRCPEALPREA